MQTPVDMTAYSSQLRVPEPIPTIVQPRATITPSLTRRAPIDMPLATPKAVAVGQNPGEVPFGDREPLPGEFDLNLDLDVPAFLRRNEG
jgi:hypothetical protein